MNKNRQIISELKDFFKHNDASRAINAVNNVMERLVIQAKTVDPVKNPNCKFTFVQLVKLLVVLPFFSVKTAADYADSALGKLFSCKKDSFYRLMDDGRIDWRRIIYSINRQLIGLISRRADAKGNTRCVILDDTDLPKRGMKAEGLGKVFSHTAMKCILGFKAMFLCYTDGKTQLMVDATIQAESAARTRKSTPVRRRCFSPKLPTPSRCSGEPSLRGFALTTCWLTAGSRVQSCSSSSMAGTSSATSSE